MLLAAVAALAGTSAHAEDDQSLLIRMVRLADDDPRAALQQAERELALARSPRQRALLLMASSRAHALLEDAAAQRQALLAAQAEASRVSDNRATLQRWLALEELSVSINEETRAQIDQRMAALRADINGSGDTVQACEFIAAELWILIDRSSLDEAWVAAESLERCSSAPPLDYLRPVALAAMGQISSELALQQGPAPTRQRAIDYLEQALQALGDQPMRFRRSLIEWDLSKAHRRAKDLDAALAHVGRALQISHELNDQAGVAAALSVMARIQLDRGNPAAALPKAEEALRLLASGDGGARQFGIMELKILALARLGRPEVLAEIERARALENEVRQPAVRADLARAMAEAYAALGRWQQGFAEMQRAHKLDGEARTAARDSQLLRLQTRYDDVRRSSEIAELRHRNETAALALKAEQAGQRTLWAMLLLLTMVLAAAAAQAWRLAQRRRVMADLALKDELTGSPNRRAVTAYAQAQLGQTQRLQLPLSLALIDLDHFKRVNDEHGHEAGDQLLRAFVQAAGQVLRGQDRIGRWGGEEWLLVMPGTPLEEMPRVFERLRNSFLQMQPEGLPRPHGQTFSMGAVQADPSAGAVALDDLVRRADQRLYRAKLNGRDRLELAD